MMNNKTVLFLANGFGIEAKGSYNVYGDKVLPTFNKLNNEYLATTLVAGGKEVGFNPTQVANFQTGFTAFSTGGKFSQSETIVDRAIKAKTFVNQGIADSIDYAVKNNSKVHVFYLVGDKFSYTALDHLKAYVDECNNKNVKEICIHLFIGNNSEKNMKFAKDYIKQITRTLSTCKNQSITFVTGINYAKDTTDIENLSKIYRINTTTVSEIWSDFDEVLGQRYRNGIGDEDIAPFLTKRRLVFEPNDSIFIINYEFVALSKYISLILKPDQLFSYGNCPAGIKITSLFPISGQPIIPFAYNYELPEIYLTKLLEGKYNKKITLLADTERMPYINSSLNGNRGGVSPFIEAKALKVQTDPFLEMTQVVLNEIETSPNDLIIVDYNLLWNFKGKDPNIIHDNLFKLDSCLRTVFDKIKEKNYTLIVTSLYGIKEEIKVGDDIGVINFSEKVPFIMIDPHKSRNTALIAGTTINDIASTVFNHLGIEGFGSFIAKKSGGKKGKIVYIILILMIVLMILCVFLL